uniref:Uncharacterized protein n=1 Tax=Arundo donax TaxID=35708 RepID=A0A0A9CBN4_ARUDO
MVVVDTIEPDGEEELITRIVVTSTCARGPYVLT